MKENIEAETKKNLLELSAVPAFSILQRTNFSAKLDESLGYAAHEIDIEVEQDEAWIFEHIDNDDDQLTFEEIMSLTPGHSPFPDDPDNSTSASLDDEALSIDEEELSEVFPDDDQKYLYSTLEPALPIYYQPPTDQTARKRRRLIADFGEQSSKRSPN